MTPQELRNSILKLAFEGKLVNQNPSEGTGDDVFKLIKEKKAELNIKSKEKDSEISSIELPYCFPKNWKCVRLGWIANTGAGGTPERGNPEYWNGNIPWLKISDITSAKIYVNSCNEFITEKGLNNSSAKIIKKGAILYTIFATIGEVAILNFDSACNQAIAFIEPYLDITKYLYWYLVNLKNFMVKQSKGCAQFNINQKILKEAIVPLPPLEEQKRIVAKIEELLPLVDKYEEAWTKLEKLNNQFPVDMEKSIIQYALQGKLTEQNLLTESADTLIQNIENKKKILIKSKQIKKEKPLSVINDKEIPYAIPDNWRWARLGTLFEFINGDRGRNYPSKDKLQEYGDIPFISAINFNKGRLRKDNLLFLTIQQFDMLGSGKLKKNDFVFCLRGSLGKYCYYDLDVGAVASSLVILRKYGFILDEYIELYLSSPVIEKQIYIKDNGTAQPNLGARDLVNFLMPLPPLEEQKRIVAKIEELLPLCRSLK